MLLGGASHVALARAVPEWAGPVWRVPLAAARPASGSVVAGLLPAGPAVAVPWR